MRYLILVMSLVLLGCMSRSSNEALVLRYESDTPEKGQVSYYIDDAFVGIGDEGIQEIINEVERLPDGATIELEDESHILYNPATRGMVLGEAKRGSSASVFDICTIPTTAPKLQKLIVDKQINVKKARQATGSDLNIQH